MWTAGPSVKKIQMSLIDKNRYRKSLDFIDIDWYRKSIVIEVTEKLIYQLLSINKIDNNR